MPLRRRALRGALLLAGGILLTAPLGVTAQSGRATLRAEENFRREPNGVVLARLSSGAPVSVIGSDGNWTEVEVEGWVWLRSLQASTEQPGLGLVVAQSGGENLRSAPSGTIVGKLEEGTLLQERERNPGWARVARRGWIWSASLTEVSSSTPATTTSGAATPAGRAAGRAGPAGGANPAPTVPPPVRRPETRVTTVGPAGAAILTAPDGDTMAVAVPASDLEIVRREGSWVRVRLEGWLWQPAAAEAPTDENPAEARALTPADLRSAPDGHAGRVVEWSLQFISLARAEAVRTDFFEGEPFLLTKHGGPDGPYVYVAIPPERVSEVQGLLPLERITVTGRVRTGASSLTGAPILDLIELVRAPEAP